MIFNKYKKILYDFEGREVELRDIFTKVTFLDDYTSSKVYDDYYIQEGESPEDVSRKVYSNEIYSWLVLMANNIITDDEWYSGDAKFLNISNRKHGGEAFYITELPDIKPGDIIIKVTGTNGNEVQQVDETNYRIIRGFDRNFRYVWGDSGSGTLSASDKIMFARRNENNGTVEALNFITSSDINETQLTQWTSIQYKENKINSPIYFKNINNDVSIPPNLIFESGSIQGESIPYDVIYTNSNDSNTDNNFARTVLYEYMTNSGSVAGVEKYTYYTDEYTKYSSRQKIRVLKPEYRTITVDLIEQLLTNNQIGKRITIGF